MNIGHKNKLLSAAIAVLFFSFFCMIPSYGQEMSVASFNLDESDLTAIYQETMVLDQNSEKCALIKIITTQREFTFDVGSLGVTKVEYRPSQVWLYVPHGVRRLSIFHNQLGALVNWNFPVSIESGKTYILKLTSDEVTTVVTKKTNMDYLVFTVTPKTALVYLNNELLETKDGIAMKFVKYGTYDYRVETPFYHTVSGQVSVDSGKKEVKVDLKQAYGYLNISGDADINKDEVFVDGKKVTKTRFALESGVHQITVQSEFRRPYVKEFEIFDEQEKNLIISLVDDYATVSVRAEPKTQIFINGEFKAEQSWTGKLASGAYRIEARREHYISVQKDIYVNNENLHDDQIIQLENLVPITGELNITSNPNGARIEMDGTIVGFTPLYLNDVIEGQHFIKLSKEGYKTLTKKITIAPSGPNVFNETLEFGARLTVNVTPTNSNIHVYLDGQEASFYFEKEMNLSNRTHELKVIDDSGQYETYLTSFEMTEDKSFEIRLQETAKYVKAEQAQRERDERAARATLRKYNRTPFPASFGMCLLNAGVLFGRSDDDAGMFYNVNLFCRLGDNKNIINVDLGAGSRVAGELENIDEDGVLWYFPVFARVNVNFGPKRHSFPFFMGLELAHNFSTAGSFLSMPIRCGFTSKHFVIDAYYEPYFRKYLSGNSPAPSDLAKGALGFGLTVIF